MCGSTSAQNELQTEQLAAYQQAQQLTAEQYSNEQAIFAPMSQQFQSILSKGPNQEGFSGSELNDLNATAVEGTAENYKNASRAVGEKMAAEGGGDNPLPTGAKEELQQNLATSAAQTESGEESEIKQADYKQGYDEWKTAGSGLMGIATGQNPLGFENAATSAGSAAGTTADQIASQNNSWINAAIGAAGAIGGGFAGR